MIQHGLRLVDRVCTKGPGAAANEDAFGFSRQCAMVVDGATTLGSSQSGASPGRLLAETVCDVATALCAEYSAAGWDAWFNEVLAQASARIARETEPDLLGARTSAAAAFVHVVDGHLLDFCLFGDCTLIVRHPEGPISAFSDERLQKLDAVSIGFLHERLLALGSLDQARNATMPILQRHRDMMNTPQGYPSLTLDGAGVGLAKRGAVPVQPGSRVLLATDGLAEAVTLFNIACWEDLLTGRLSLSDAEEALRLAQEEDPNCMVYPRLKKGDDSTGLLLELATGT